MLTRQIGDCTLYQGDCLEILPTLGKVDAVVTDPPYQKEAHTPKLRARSGGLHKNMPLDFNALSNGQELTVSACVKNICSGWFISFCQAEQVAVWRDAIEEAGLKYKTPMIWVKPDCTPKINGQGPAIGYESLVTAWCGRGYARWNAGGKRGVYTHLTNPGSRTHTHMTEKPILLMLEILLDFTCTAETVCDPFMGSGTTGVACVKLGRKFIGIEIERKYFEIACERIQKAVNEPRLPMPEPKLKQEKMAL